jgi:beta-lactamase class A
MFLRVVGGVFLLLFAATSASAQDADLKKVFDRLVPDAHGRAGIAATLIETGEAVDSHGDERFPMQSVYKLPIAMAVMAKVDKHELRLDQRVTVAPSDFVTPGQGSPIRDKFPKGTSLTLRELLRYAVSESDGTASDVLLRLAGGPDAAQAYLHANKLDGLAIVTTEKAMGLDRKAQYKNWATPRGMLDVLRSLYRAKAVSPASRDLLLQWMTESKTFPSRIRGYLPQGTVVAHKTGTSGTDERGVTAANNDVGIITVSDTRHVAIAAFVSDSLAEAPRRDGVIARAARAAYDYWSSSRRAALLPESVMAGPCSFSGTAFRTGIEEALVKRRVEPDLTGLAPLSGKPVAGAEVLINEQGVVTEVCVTQSIRPDVDARIAAALKQWTYEPPRSLMTTTDRSGKTYKRGERVPIITTVTLPLGKQERGKQ